MADKNNKSNNGVGFLTLLFLLFLGLKLGHVIDWSWWWVTAPIWGGFALVAIVLVAYAVGLMLVDLAKIVRRKFK